MTYESVGSNPISLSRARLRVLRAALLMWARSDGSRAAGVPEVADSISLGVGNDGIGVGEGSSGGSGSVAVYFG